MSTSPNGTSPSADSSPRSGADVGRVNGDGGRRARDGHPLRDEVVEARHRLARSPCATCGRRSIRSLRRRVSSSSPTTGPPPTFPVEEIFIDRDRRLVDWRVWADRKSWMVIPKIRAPAAAATRPPSAEPPCGGASPPGVDRLSRHPQILGNRRHRPPRRHQVEDPPTELRRISLRHVRPSLTGSGHARFKYRDARKPGEHQDVREPGELESQAAPARRLTALIVPVQSESDLTQ